jgi:hypothetical protein
LKSFRWSSRILAQSHPLSDRRRGSRCNRYGVMVTLVAYVTPQPRQMTYTIPAQRLNK